jgi:hypothetical protein
MVVIGWASEMTANVVWSEITVSREARCRTKLVTPAPGPAMGENDMDWITFGTKQCAAVKIVRID